MCDEAWPLSSQASCCACEILPLPPQREREIEKEVVRQSHVRSVIWNSFSPQPLYHPIKGMLAASEEQSCLMCGRTGGVEGTQ